MNPLSSRVVSAEIVVQSVQPEVGWSSTGWTIIHCTFAFTSSPLSTAESCVAYTFPCMYTGVAEMRLSIVSRQSVQSG